MTSFTEFVICAQVTLTSPVLNDKELDLLKADDVLRPKTLTMFFNVSKGIPGALQRALGTLCKAADEAVRAGSQLLILSDRTATLVSLTFVEGVLIFL